MMQNLFNDFCILYGILFFHTSLVCRQPYSVKQFCGAVEYTATADDDKG